MIAAIPSNKRKPPIGFHPRVPPRYNGDSDVDQAHSLARMEAIVSISHYFRVACKIARALARKQIQWVNGTNVSTHVWILMGDPLSVYRQTPSLDLIHKFRTSPHLHYRQWLFLCKIRNVIKIHLKFLNLLLSLRVFWIKIMRQSKV